MTDSGEICSRRTNSKMEGLSLQPNRIPRDLLRTFIEAGSSSSRRSEFLVVKKEEEESEEIELNLNLGLSLGGIFGADKSSNKLIRSSSIAGPIPIARLQSVMAPADDPPAYASLIRTSSLPVETEDEWRKRKELQSLRRMMAKRRRSEKQRSSKADKDGGAVEEKRESSKELNLRGKVERQQYISAMNKVGSSAAPPFRLPTWTAGSKGGGGGRSSSASVDSQGGSCSSMSENKPFHGSGSCGDAASMQSLQEGSNVESSDQQMDKSPNPCPSPSSSSRKAEIMEEIGGNSNRLENMPCVFTKGDGPNGRTIEGILYRYGKGEEVRIMCVCHGTFHSPAEFVKHAGGTDVAHPLKHIVVNPNSSSSF